MNTEITRGRPFPLGATLTPDGINFAVTSHHATACFLVIFEKGAAEPLADIPFPLEWRVGDVFAMHVSGLEPQQIEYGFRMDGEYDEAAGNRFDSSHILLDPYAKQIGGQGVWGQPSPAHMYPHRAQILTDTFDWEDDQPPLIPENDLIIYEMHLRGFTSHLSANVTHRGTFDGMREKIPHLKALGINCVELLPIQEFDETANKFVNPETGRPLMNYWGYSQLGFFAPKAGYAAAGAMGGQAAEFKSLIKALHAEGIEIILDVVYNHTAEEDDDGPTLSFRGLDNATYYLLTPEGENYNFSGCGNSINANHPVVRDFILDSLRYWVMEYHVDGFRFDLASALTRDQRGWPLDNPSLIESIARDPILANCKLIAEAWDAAGLYQVGTFPHNGRFSEWNGRYRDDMRRFLRSEAGQIPAISRRLLGSPDIYANRSPLASINFITSHDGFSLHDLFAYDKKHNWANGENNQDGDNNNLSWNCGVEGETDDAEILTLRRRLMYNSIALLMLSQGIPMLLMGDEIEHTKRGNNNTYGHDNELNWFNWDDVKRNPNLLYFCQQMIAFRHAHPLLRQSQFLHQRRHESDPVPREQAEISWHGVKAWSPDWAEHSHTIAFMLSHPTQDDCIYAAINMHWKRHWFELPSLPSSKSSPELVEGKDLDDGCNWHQFVNTGAARTGIIAPVGEERPLLQQKRVLVNGRSLVVLVGKK